MGATYGTLLAGLPVLIAILVAKQQLELARLHHLATFRLAFQKEIDALNNAKLFAERLKGYTFPKARIASLLAGTDGAFVPTLHHDEYAQLQSHLPFEISHALKIAMNSGEMLQEKANAGEYQGDGVGALLKHADWIANYCIDLIDNERQRLSQYWS